MNSLKKQKNAIRLLSNAKYNAHTEPLFKTLDILPLPSLIQFFQLQFMQHFQQRFLPVIFSDAWIYNSVREIGENSIVLRNMDQLRVPFARISLVEKLPLVSFPTIWEILMKTINSYGTRMNSIRRWKLTYRNNCHM